MSVVGCGGVSWGCVSGACGLSVCCWPVGFAARPCGVWLSGRGSRVPSQKGRRKTLLVLSVRDAMQRNVAGNAFFVGQYWFATVKYYGSKLGRVTAPPLPYRTLANSAVDFQKFLRPYGRPAASEDGFCIVQPPTPTATPLDCSHNMCCAARVAYLLGVKSTDLKSLLCYLPRKNVEQ